MSIAPIRFVAKPPEEVVVQQPDLQILEQATVRLELAGSIAESIWTTHRRHWPPWSNGRQRRILGRWR